MNYKHILATLSLLASTQVNASDKIGIEEDSEETTSSFTVLNDLQVALNGMKEAYKIQNRLLSFQSYHPHLLEVVL